MSELHRIWSDRYRVNWHETDVSNSASLVTISNFLQVSAFRHAQHLGFDYTRKDGFDKLWVLIRLLIKMDRYPSWNEEVEVKTWHRGAEGLVALRDFEILDASGNRLGAAASHWFLLDPQTRKPVIPEFADTANTSIHPVAVMEEQPGRIPIRTDLPLLRTVSVTYTDLDMYRHANNSRYIDWILNCFPETMHREYAITSFQIEFLSEARYEDEVRIFASLHPESSLVKGIRTGDDATIFRARINWKPR